MADETLKIFCDGGSRGNPGPAGIGVVIVEPLDRMRRFKKYIGNKTNNQAEYEALLFALKTVENDYRDAQEIKIYLDSELVVRQMRGEYKIKNEGLGKILIKIHNLIIKLDLKVSFDHIVREKNHQADRLVNWAIDEGLKNKK